MRAISIVTTALAAFALSACATSYQADSWTGGFSETKVAPNAFRVSFRGNAFTSRNGAEEMTLLRSAELTLKSGFSYFVIVEGRSGVDVSQVVTPAVTTSTATFGTAGGVPSMNAYSTTTGGQAISIAKPSTTNTIVCYASPPAGVDMVYDARFLTQSLGRKYRP